MNKSPVNQHVGFSLSGVDELIGTVSAAIGSVEGTLEALTIHKTTAFSVYDAITARRVPCNCSREILNKAMEHFGKRVSVSGEIKFNVQGEVISIKVSEFLPLGEGSLPQAKDVRGLFADNKVDIDEWSRLVREK